LAGYVATASEKRGGGEDENKIFRVYEKRAKLPTWIFYGGLRGAREGCIIWCHENESPTQYPVKTLDFGSWFVAFGDGLRVII
jgi:hypothetical protein